MGLTIYFYYELVNQGNLFVTDGRSSLSETFENPMLLLLPSLSIFAATLFLMRFLSLFMRSMGWGLQWTDNIGLLVATRHLERTPGYYILPTILLVCTISLGVFVATYALTLDRALFEQNYYRFLGDLRVRVFARPNPLAPNDAPPANMPLVEYNDIEGIESLTRLAEMRITIEQSGPDESGQLIGIDRADFAQISFWREDFASQRLGDLLNQLAARPDVVLVSREWFESNQLQIGDTVRIEMRVLGDAIPATVTIGGVLDYFPGWYPEQDGVLMVANLNHLNELVGIEVPFEVIARTEPNFDPAEMRRVVFNKGAGGVIIEEPLDDILRAQSQADRQGLFGLLSIGFVSSVVATVLGFFLYALFSYRRRFVELGVLRAVGMTQIELLISVAWELGLLIVMGIGLGLGIGTAVSQLYIPYLQIGLRERELVPPYLVTMAWIEIWQIVILFGVLFMVSLYVLVSALRRMKIFQAVKLGETV